MMRKIIILMICLTSVITGCVDYNDMTTAITVKVLLQMPSDISGATMSGHTVTMLNNSGESLSAVTDDDGIATFENIIPDVYTLSISWNISSDEYKLLTGDDEVNDGAVISGVLNSQLLSGNMIDDPLVLPLNMSINRSVVIGKIYYAGSRDNNHRNYDGGKYMEIYNQSDDSVDMSGLYLGFTETMGPAPGYTLEQLHELYADSVLMLKQIFQIPTDAPCMVAPGEVILLTNSATDHTVNDSLEHDLTNADFEAKDIRGRILNNADVPALTLIYTAFPTLTYLNLLNSAPNGAVIFRTDIDISALPKVYNYGKTKGNEWVVFPKRYVIDAVEMLKLKASGEVDLSTKRLYDELDAGYININSVIGRNAEVVYRKTSTRKGADGHKILEDTNNSSNDFQVSTTINPWEYD